MGSCDIITGRGGVVLVVLAATLVVERKLAAEPHIEEIIHFCRLYITHEQQQIVP